MLAPTNPLSRRPCVLCIASAIHVPHRTAGDALDLLHPRRSIQERQAGLGSTDTMAGRRRAQLIKKQCRVRAPMSTATSLRAP